MKGDIQRTNRNIQPLEPADILHDAASQRNAACQNTYESQVV
jgi:hypothetical protein